MRLTAALAIPLVLSLAACGGGRPKGVVRFTGIAPNTAAQKAKDDRGVVVTCPGPCANKDGSKSPLAYGADKCPVKNCVDKLAWDKTYICPSCNGGGSCSACALLEQQDGKCFDCAGSGVKIYAGKSPECSNCKGKKVCPICDGSKKCDFCKGEGKLDDAAVQALAGKSAPKASGEDEGGK
jgi:hypothetical protein